MGAKAKVRKAVIAAAGYGTRFLPQTKAMPKEMLPLVDKPIIQYIVEDLVEAGIEDIIIVTTYSKRAIEDHFDSPSSELVASLGTGSNAKKELLRQVEAIANLANFVYVRQKGDYGNGTPLLNVEHLIGDEPFIFAFGDDFIAARPNKFSQLIKSYEQYGCCVLGCIKAKGNDYDKLGFAAGKILDNSAIRVETIIEKPGKAKAPSDLATVSGGLLTPEVFKYLHRAKANLKPGQELYYNDAFKLMIADGRSIVAKEIENGRFYDAGDKLEYLKTVVDFGLMNKEIGSDFASYLRSLKV